VQRRRPPALKEYVHRTMTLPDLYDWFLKALRSNTSPRRRRLRRLMCPGKLYDLVSDSKYDRVISMTRHRTCRIDAARTAHHGRGRTHRSAAPRALKIQLMLQNDVTTRIVIVSLAEEMAIREAAELARYVTGDLAMHLGPMIVNRVTPQISTAPRSRRYAPLHLHRRRLRAW
jgi:hypothetical protein